MKARPIWDNRGVSSPSEIVVFLRARLEEDEHIARAAVAAPWAAKGGSISGGSPPNHGDFGEVHILPYASNEYDPDEATAAHIARHDPARVLADIQSKRRVVDAYVEWSAVPQAQVANFNDGFAAGLLSAVEALAAAYSDHPDYRPGWRL